jgi:hypothetical protein
MDNIFNELPEEHSSKETQWIYKENKEVFDKFNQIQPVLIKSPKVIVSQEIIQDTIKPKEYIKNLKKKDTPLDLIMEYTKSNKIMKSEVKQKLIELISIPEFGKAFGIKKSAEIISAITRDSWNQSTALFISFLLDSDIIYKEKSYLFNKEKNNQQICVCVN